MDRAELQGPCLDGLLPAPPLSQGNESEPSAADAENEDEHHGQSIQKREDLFYDLVLFLREPRVERLVRGLGGGIDAGVVDAKGQVGHGKIEVREVLGHRWSWLGGRGRGRTLGDGDVGRGRGLEP